MPIGAGEWGQPLHRDRIVSIQEWRQRVVGQRRLADVFYARRILLPPLIECTGGRLGPWIAREAEHAMHRVLDRPQQRLMGSVDPPGSGLGGARESVQSLRREGTISFESARTLPGLFARRMEQTRERVTSCQYEGQGWREYRWRDVAGWPAGKRHWRGRVLAVHQKRGRKLATLQVNAGHTSLHFGIRGSWYGHPLEIGRPRARHL